MEEGAKKKGTIVYAVYADPNFIKTSKELNSAFRAYYMATGDPSQLRFPPIPCGWWKTLQNSVEKYFGKIAKDSNSELIRILPWIYGFATECAVVILEVEKPDYGVPATFFVALRQRRSGEKIEFSSEPSGYKAISEGYVGLHSVVEFQNPDGWNLRTSSKWTENLNDESLSKHTQLLLEYGKSFLTDPKADWAGLQKWLKQKREKILAERPWLKKFSRS